MLTGITALSMAFSLSACGGSGAEEASDGPFTVGYLGPIAGPLAYLTEGDLAGLRTYVDSVNADGGVNGRKIEIKVLDDQAKPDTAATQYRQLVRDGASVVAGMPISTTGEALLRDTGRDKVPTIGYGLVTETLVESEYSFTTGWTPVQYAQAVATFIESQDLGSDVKIGFVGSETAASKEAADVITDYGKKHNAWSMVGETFLPASLTDVGPSLAPIARAQPDLIVQWTPSLEIIASAYKAHKLDEVPVLAPYYTDEVQGSALKLPNYYYPQLFVSPGSGDPGVKGIAAAATRSGHEDDLDKPFFGFGYAAGALIVAALEACPGACDGEQFAKTLRETRTTVDGFTDGDFGFGGPTKVAFTSARWMHFDAKADFATKAVTDWFTVS